MTKILKGINYEKFCKFNFPIYSEYGSFGYNTRLLNVGNCNGHPIGYVIRYDCYRNEIDRMSVVLYNCYPLFHLHYLGISTEYETISGKEKFILK